MNGAGFMISASCATTNSPPPGIALRSASCAIAVRTRIRCCNLDSTFNSPVFDFGADAAVAESANALAIQPTGQVVAGGGAGQFGAGGFGVARFNTNGHFDPTFGNAGKVTTPFLNAAANVRGLLSQPDGRIVAVGTEIVNGGSPANLVAARYLGQ